MTARILFTLFIIAFSISTNAQISPAEKAQLCSSISKIVNAWPADYRKQVSKAAPQDSIGNFYTTSYSSSQLPVVLQLNGKKDPGRIYIFTKGNNNNVPAYFAAVKSCLPGKASDWQEKTGPSMAGYKRADACIVVVAYDSYNIKIMVEISSGYTPTISDKLPAINFPSKERQQRSYTAYLFPPETKNNTSNKSIDPKTTSFTTISKLLKSSPNAYTDLCKEAISDNGIYKTNEAFWDFPAEYPDRYIWTKPGGVAQYHSSSRWFKTKDSAQQLLTTIGKALEEGLGSAGSNSTGQSGNALQWIIPRNPDPKKKPYDLVFKIYTGQRANGDWNVTFLCSNNTKP